MKRTVLVLLFLSLAGLLLVNLGSANYVPPPSIEIFSPISTPKIYQDTSVPLQVTVNVLTGEPDITSIRYNLDGKANVTLTNLTREDGVSYWTTTKGVFAKGNAFHAESSLDNLAEGKHTLNVYSQDAEGKEMSHSIEFTVDYDYVPPQPLVTGYLNHTAIPTINTDQHVDYGKNPLPYILGIAALVTITIIIIACLAVYFKKRKREVKS